MTPIETTEITLGEVYRLIRGQSDDLTEIKADVKKQNGSVANLSTRVAVLEERSGVQGHDNLARYAGGAGVLSALATWLYQFLGKHP